MLIGAKLRTNEQERVPNHLQRNTVEDQIAEGDRVTNEVRATVAQQRRDDEAKRLHHEEAQQTRRADRHHNPVDEARRLAVQPSDGADLRKSVTYLVDDLHMQRT